MYLLRTGAMMALFPRRKSYGSRSPKRNDKAPTSAKSTSLPRWPRLWSLATKRFGVSRCQTLRDQKLDKRHCGAFHAWDTQVQPGSMTQLGSHPSPACEKNEWHEWPLTLWKEKFQQCVTLMFQKQNYVQYRRLHCAKTVNQTRLLPSSHCSTIRPDLWDLLKQLLHVKPDPREAGRINLSRSLTI